jgi:hypothetical protein
MCLPAHKTIGGMDCGLAFVSTQRIKINQNYGLLWNEPGNQDSFRFCISSAKAIEK